MIDIKQRLQLPSGASPTYYSLPLLEKRGVARVSRLPVSLRIVLESVLRNLDGERIRDEDVEALARWQPNAARTAEVPFVVGRVLLQDFTGVPLLVDLAAMRSAVARRGARRRAGAAARPGRSGDRSLGAGRLLRPRRCAPAQHGDGVPPQRRALPVPQVGSAGVRRAADRPAGLRHLPPGEPRVPGARRSREGRRAVSRHAGRHGLAHAR